MPEQKAMQYTACVLYRMFGAAERICMMHAAQILSVTRVTDSQIITQSPITIFCFTGIIKILFQNKKIVLK